MGRDIHVVRFFDAVITLEPAPPPIGLVAPEGEFLVVPAETPSRAVLLMADEREDVAFDDQAIIDQFALMPTGRDMLLAGSALGTAGGPALMEFLERHSGEPDFDAVLAQFAPLRPDSISPAGVVTWILERGGGGGGAARNSHGADFQIIETPRDKSDAWLDPQFGHVDLGDGSGYDDANGNGQYDEGETITSTGRLPPLDYYYYEPYTPPEVRDGGTGGGGGGGGGTVGESAEFDIRHTQDCGSMEGAAEQVGEAIKRSDDPNAMGNTKEFNWTNSEFGAFLALDSNGRIGAVNDVIHTDGVEDLVTLRTTSLAGIVGEIHSHPAETDAANDPLFRNAVRRYPSNEDFDDVTAVFTANNIAVPAGYTIFILGPDGEVRGFPYADRELFKAMSEASKVRGDNLPEAVTGKACGT